MPRRAQRTRALVAGGLAGVVLAALLVTVAVRFAARHPDEANLGPRVLRLDADRLAREVAERGPVLFKDPLDRGREIYVQHVGRDPEGGWLAVSAYASGRDERCLLRWERQRRRFVDPCSGRAYPADGAGLTTYPATVRDGVVTLDLRKPRPPATAPGVTAVPGGGRAAGRQEPGSFS